MEKINTFENTFKEQLRAKLGGNDYKFHRILQKQELKHYKVSS